MEHVLEAFYEGLDGYVRDVTGHDNVIYDLHGTNARDYINFSNQAQEGTLTMQIEP
jgi:hypothetical protein